MGVFLSGSARLAHRPHCSVDPFQRHVPANAQAGSSGRSPQSPSFHSAGANCVVPSHRRQGPPHLGCYLRCGRPRPGHSRHGCPQNCCRISGAPLGRQGRLSVCNHRIRSGGPRCSSAGLPISLHGIDSYLCTSRRYNSCIRSRGRLPQANMPHTAPFPHASSDHVRPCRAVFVTLWDCSAANI